MIFKYISSPLRLTDFNLFSKKSSFCRAAITFKILKVIAALQNDDFFENKLKSVSLKGDDIYLNITGFDFDIRFGNEFQLKNKLNMLKGFYIYQFDNSSNKKYKQVDLVYNNRLIAIKN